MFLSLSRARFSSRPILTLKANLSFTHMANQLCLQRPFLFLQREPETDDAGSVSAVVAGASADRGPLEAESTIPNDVGGAAHNRGSSMGSGGCSASSISFVVADGAQGKSASSPVDRRSTTFATSGSGMGLDPEADVACHETVNPQAVTTSDTDNARAETSASSSSVSATTQQPVALLAASPPASSPTPASSATATTSPAATSTHTTTPTATTAAAATAAATSRPVVVVGTAGFAYAHWRRGVFYPKGLRHQDELKHYSGVFAGCEINTTFHAVPKESVLAG
jgi:hypothetical protein